MTSVLRRGISTTVRAAAPLGLITAVAAMLLRFPPAQDHVYPVCPVYFVLHLQCPGCGGTRALAALLHGHLRDALHWNALVTLMLPLAAGYGGVLYWRFLQRKALGWPQAPPVAIYAGLAIAAVFTIERNLPAPW